MIYKDIHTFLENYDSDNVVFCYGNNAVTDMATNLVLSAKRVGMSIVLFALDKKISDALKDMCDVVNYFDKNIDQDKFYDYGTQEYKKIVWHGFFIGHEILRYNKSYLYLDIDIIIMKEFEDEIVNKLYYEDDTDCVVQGFKAFPHSDIFACTGLVAMKPTERTLAISPEYFRENSYLNWGNDQLFFNEMIMRTKLLNIKTLNINMYPVGSHYYAEHAKIKNMCRIVHFNSVIGRAAKIEKMKEFNLYNNV